MPLKLPHTTLDNKRLFYKMVKRTCRKADLILTISETSRQDIISILGADEDRVVNTYESVSIPAKFLKKDASRVRKNLKNSHKLNLTEYILFYGAIEPKKKGQPAGEGLSAVGYRHSAGDRRQGRLAAGSGNPRSDTAGCHPLLKRKWRDRCPSCPRSESSGSVT